MTAFPLAPEQRSRVLADLKARRGPFAHSVVSAYEVASHYSLRRYPVAAVMNEAAVTYFDSGHTGASYRLYVFDEGVARLSARGVYDHFLHERGLPLKWGPGRTGATRRGPREPRKPVEPVRVFHWKPGAFERKPVPLPAPGQALTPEALWPAVASATSLKELSRRLYDRGVMSLPYDDRVVIVRPLAHRLGIAVSARSLRNALTPCYHQRGGHKVPGAGPQD